MVPLSRDTVELPRNTPVPHTPQRGCVRRHTPLGCGGGGNRGGHGGTWPVNTVLGDVLLF